MAKLHYFNPKVAKIYGINGAVVLQYLWFWVYINESKNINYHDGRYWTYNTVEKIAEYITYLSEKQISYAIEKLVDDGAVVKGNYNKTPYDRTLWYALTEKGYSFFQNCKIEEANLSIPNDKKGEPIPNITTNRENHSFQTNKKGVPLSNKSSVAMLIDEYSCGDDETKQLLELWLEMCRETHSPIAAVTLKLNLEKLDSLASESNMSVPEYLKEVIRNGWKTFYPIRKQYYAQKNKMNSDDTANGTFETDDFFEKALRRSYRDYPKMDENISQEDVDEGTSPTAKS